MMTKFEPIWNGHFGCISIVKHCIRLTLIKTRLLHGAPYRAGTRESEFEKKEIKKMLKMGGTEPVETECSAAVVFCPKKDGSLRFSIGYRK